MPSSVVIGDARITLVRVGSYWWDGGAMFGVVPKTLWSKHHKADELNRIEAGFNCFVIETGGRRILVETGGGGFQHDARWKSRARMESPVDLADALTQAGFEPDSIDTVINTHLHWDHASGNTTDRGGVIPALPQAKYLVQRNELKHAREQHPRDAVSYLAVNYEPLVDAGVMQLLDGDFEAAPGVSLQVAPGHNRDMMVVIVRSTDKASGGETWCHLADLAPYAAHVTPTWVAAFDLFPLETIATKQEILGWAAAEGWWLSFGHDPSVAFAKIEVREGKWQVQQQQL